MPEGEKGIRRRNASEVSDIRRTLGRTRGEGKQTATQLRHPIRTKRSTTSRQTSVSLIEFRRL